MRQQQDQDQKSVHAIPYHVIYRFLAETLHSEMVPIYYSLCYRINDNKVKVYCIAENANRGQEVDQKFYSQFGLT